MTHTLFMYALRLGFDWLVGLCVSFVVAKNEVYDIPLKTDLNLLLTPFHSWTDLMWFCVSVFKKGSIQTCCLLQRNFITHVWGKMYGLITNTWTTFYMHGKLFTRWHTPMCICHSGLCCKPGIVLCDLCENRLIKTNMENLHIYAIIFSVVFVQCTCSSCSFQT